MWCQSLPIKNKETICILKTKHFVLEGTLVSSRAEITLCQGETNSPSSFKQDMRRIIRFLLPGLTLVTRMAEARLCGQLLLGTEYRLCDPVVST